jgi:hypothetical protein
VIRFVHIKQLSNETVDSAVQPLSRIDVFAI